MSRSSSPPCSPPPGFESHSTPGHATTAREKAKTSHIASSSNYDPCSLGNSFDDHQQLLKQSEYKPPQEIEFSVTRIHSHPSRDPRRNPNLIPCIYFNSGNCNLGNDCPFSHNIAKGSCRVVDHRLERKSSENEYLKQLGDQDFCSLKHQLSSEAAVCTSREGDEFEEIKKGEAESKNPQENRSDHEEKTKVSKDDAEALDEFRTKLIEFVKALLMPVWNEGKLSLENFKSIVGKATHKVLDDTMKRPSHIPRTKKDINKYLSVNRPNIAKLVQAYVEKVQKSETRAEAPVQLTM